jgi:hypothetical protein
MERRDFLKLTFGFAVAVAAAATLARGAQAAPLSPQPLRVNERSAQQDAQPAVTTRDEVDHLKPEEVHWGHHWHHRHWGHRHWGWRHRHWHRHHWHRHHWHRHYW